MKKSIFLFFAAILCAMTANAQLYLRGGFNDWGTSDEFKFVSNVCEIELAGGATHEFKIADSGWGTNFGGNHTFTATATKTLTSGGGNMKITTTIPGTYRFEFVESTKNLTVTYPEIPAPHDITVRAQVPAHWTNDIYAHVWTSENGSGQDVGPLTKNGDYYEVTKNAGALYVIFKNGSAWSDKNQTVDLCYTEDVCLQLNQSGTAKATATVIDCGAVAKDITVKAVVPGAWENTITAWVWPTGGEGKEVTPTKDGNWYVVTENCIELNVIFKNGEGWNGNENQTANIAGVSENTCYQISAINKDSEGKCTYTVVDCEAAIEPEAKPAPVPTFDYYVTGSFNGWNEKDPNHGMTLDGEVYKATVTLAEGDNTLKVTDGTWDKTWGANELGAAYEEVSNPNDYNNIKIALAAEKEITVIFDATAGKITFEGLTPYVAPLTYTVTVPEGTEKCYIAGPKNDWSFQEMTATANENEFTITITGAKETDEYKYACQADWAYAEVIEGGGNRTAWTALDNVTAWNKPAVITYQLKGVGGWSEAGIEMTENPDKAGEYKLTCQAISATDAVKVVKLADGVITDYYGNGTVKDGVEVAVNYDSDGNITLAEGNYNFYFDTNEAEKKLWIAAATGCPATVTVEDPIGSMSTYTGVEENAGVWSKVYNIGDEVTIGLDELGDGWAFAYWTVGSEKVFTETYTFTVTEDIIITANYGMAMDVAFDNLELDAENGFVTAGPDAGFGIELTLGIDMVNDHPKGFGLVAGSQIYLGEDELELVTGYFTAVDVDAPSAEAVVFAVYEEMLMAFVCTMTAAPAPAYIIEVENATLNDDTDNSGFLYMNGTWSDGTETYPVQAEIPGFNANVASATYAVTVTVGGQGEFDPWLGSAEGDVTVTVNAGLVTLTGSLVNGWTGFKADVTISGTLPVATPDYTRTVTTGEWGTICLPYASSSFTGATFYEVSSLVVGEGLWLDQLADDAQLEAGKPYIFKATATEITVTYTGEEVGAPVEGANGLTGTFTDIAAGGLTGNYIIAENQVWSAGTGATLSANRAYIDATSVPTTAQAQIPGRRRVRMGAEDEGTSTGFENITTTDKAVKIIENGQLIIIRDGVKYNAMGVKL